MNARGSVFKYPDNVDTDVIIPARHLNILEDHRKTELTRIAFLKAEKGIDG